MYKKLIWIDGWKYTYTVLKLRIKQVKYESKKKMATARDHKKLSVLPKNSAEGFRSKRDCFWGYVSAYENTTQNLPHLSPKSCCNFT